MIKLLRNVLNSEELLILSAKIRAAFIKNMIFSKIKVASSIVYMSQCAALPIVHGQKNCQ
jgi:hypothetical protein